MNGIAIFLLLVVLTVLVAEAISRGRYGRIVYTWTWGWLVSATERLSWLFDWRIYGDIALTLVVGPLLAHRWVKHRRLAYFTFFTVFAYLFILPYRGSTVIHLSSLLGPLVVLLSGFSGYTLLLIGTSAYGILEGYVSGEHPEPGIAPALPGVSVGGFKIPLVEGVIALFIALLVHEMAHGVVAIRENIPVRRGGIITLGLVPIGAFVEPDDKVFERKGRLARMRVLSAGPIANIFVFLLAATLLYAMTPMAGILSDYECAHGKGVRILSVPEYLSVNGRTIPSASYGVLESGDIILEINGTRIRCYSDFFDVLAPINESEANVLLPILFERNGSVLEANITTVHGFMGIRGVENVPESGYPLWYHALSFVISLVSWIALLNFMIGLINTLPLVPLDGGLIYRDMFRGGLAYRALLALSALLLLINALPWFL